MKIEIDAKELNKVKGNFETRSKRIKTAVSRILRMATLTVEKKGKEFSPVKTGRMRASIITTEITEKTASVQPTVFYAPFVHKRIPFMWAAREDAVPEIQRFVDKEIKTAIK